MARPRKIGLDYFPVDVYFDEQLESLIELHGNDALAWMIRFWQKAYRTNDGIVDLSDIRGVIGAKTSRISTDKQSVIICDAIKLGLLIQKEPQHYTSNGIQKRLDKITKDRNNDRNYAKNELSDSFRSDNLPITGESKVKERKVKEIKGKESKEKKIELPDHLVEIWPDFLEMRSKIRKPATDRAQRNIIAELESLAPGDKDKQIRIIEQSITNSWQGVFALKDTEGFKPSRQRFGRQEVSMESLRQQADIDLTKTQGLLPWDHNKKGEK